VRDPNGEDQAYCKACRKTLRPHLADLKKHATSHSHETALRRIHPPQSQRKIQDNGGLFLVCINIEETCTCPV